MSQDKSRTAALVALVVVIVGALVLAIARTGGPTMTGLPPEAQRLRALEAELEANWDNPAERERLQREIRKIDIELLIDELRREMADEPDPEQRRWLEEEIAEMEQELAELQQ